ncbi:bifunctional acetaldehyde-CoA/alcohol dehydrogenase [Candidatus Desulforudis audaxviator]|uniref:Aldehyde-alcohol dehydrogenase n=1 Tax=Desulforudis audaxviator (strain MP104C) TaxID=477974 RepID=B1I685_DESAP|nr:bifunctional acetaldehyde-CoA/alcohol dehydrogenase [Candidatus Desulforudis audaxviator]ACA60533.1 iron-containing alcohol dehydrogenase [Candidatus Desulforudis audaxviator MP104C]AZK60604.1 Alcohol dehydrogenase [Candidatus Desulforudis audaxviator]
MTEDQAAVKKDIDDLVSRARNALEQFRGLGQERVDEIVRSAALAGLERHMELARMAVEETGRGVYEDKILKNLYAVEYVYNSIRDRKTAGVVYEDPETGYREIAEPAGVIAALIPLTNPTSTTLFKGLIALKTRNPVVFSFHPGARRSSTAAAEALLEGAVAAGAPPECLLWIEDPTVEAARTLMRHPGVNLILATGGTAMVRAAYSAGIPALGVGPGNVPCYIHRTAHLERAVTDLILSKTFDHGMICASEQALIVDRAVSNRVRELMEAAGCRFLNAGETRLLEQLATAGRTCSLNPQIVGKSPVDIARMAGFEVPEDTKILVAVQEGVGPDHPLSREKLSPVLAFYVVGDTGAAIERAAEVVRYEGLGHTAVIHAADREVIESFSQRVPAGRIILNSPASQGALGDLYNVLTPSLTLGCGYIGHNSTTDNVSAVHLVDIKRVAPRRAETQWFRVPPEIYFEPGSLSLLSQMPGLGRVFLVTDEVLAELGYVDRVRRHLESRTEPVRLKVFSGVEPNPSLETVRRGTRRLGEFNPDTIIALGGGSVIDAAKAMWLFHEYPEVRFEHLKLKFTDIRKRTYRLPARPRKTRLVAVPTTSGSGSEVTAFAVITDRDRDIKYPLADYALTPDVAIVDVDLAMGQPPALTADAGMDVLGHALEAYVSVRASDFTDPPAIKAIEAVFRYLPRAYRNPGDREAREKMHTAATLAGMAFTNAFLGVNHSLAHKLGNEFNLPHGRAVAVLMPHVIEYNAEVPAKYASYPNYGYYRAAERYQEIARHLGLPASTAAEGSAGLAETVRRLIAELDLPPTIAACGVPRDRFEARLALLAEKAYEDQTTVTNPRQPLISELIALYRRAY